MELAALAGVADRIEIHETFDDKVLEGTDIITNSGHLRPIDRSVISKLPRDCVIALMFETWEFRGADIDLSSRPDMPIRIVGVNERHPAIDVFSYLGPLCVNMLHESRHSRFTKAKSRSFATMISDLLSRAAWLVLALYSAISNLEALEHGDWDAIVFALQPMDTPRIDRFSGEFPHRAGLRRPRSWPNSGRCRPRGTGGTRPPRVAIASTRARSHEHPPVGDWAGTDHTAPDRWLARGGMGPSPRTDRARRLRGNFLEPVSKSLEGNNEASQLDKSQEIFGIIYKAKWKKISWRRGLKGHVSARFAALRIRFVDGPPQRILDKGQLHLPGGEVWLTGEWRSSGDLKYYLSNLPADTNPNDLDRLCLPATSAAQAGETQKDPSWAATTGPACGPARRYQRVITKANLRTMSPRPNRRDPHAKPGINGNNSAKVALITYVPIYKCYSRGPLVLSIR